MVNIPLEKLSTEDRLEDNFLQFSRSSANLAGMTPKSKKIILISGGIVVLSLVFFWWKNRQAAVATGTLPGSAPAGSSTTTTGSVASSAANTAGGSPGQSSLYPLGDADIQQVYNRLPPAVQVKYAALVKGANAAQFDMLRSIAHGWNASIPLTPDQSAFWTTNGVF